MLRRRGIWDIPCFEMTREVNRIPKKILAGGTSDAYGSSVHINTSKSIKGIQRSPYWLWRRGNGSGQIELLNLCYSVKTKVDVIRLKSLIWNTRELDSPSYESRIVVIDKKKRLIKGQVPLSFTTVTLTWEIPVKSHTFRVSFQCS